MASTMHYTAQASGQTLAQESSSRRGGPIGMPDTYDTPRRGCGCLSALSALALLVAAAAVGAFALLNLPGTVGESLRASVPAGVTRAAAQLGSEVATSARAVMPIAESVTSDPRLRSTRPHIELAAGKAFTIAPQKFSFNGVKYSVTPHVANTVYWGAKKSTRLLVQLPGETDAEWTDAYYRAFAEDPAQRAAITDVADQLRAIRDRAHLDQDEYLELMAKYVQSLPYDWKTYNSGAGKQRFPVETLVDGIGLCGDKSVLLADLLAHEGYSAALLEFGPEKHMAVGVLGPGQTYASSGYLFLETTSASYITDVPKVYTGGMKLRSAPVVIRIGTGSLQYAAADQISKIIAVRESAQKASDTLYKTAKSQSLDNAQVTQVNRKLNQAYKAQTSLRSNVVNSDGKSVGAFMDRTAAMRWIDLNAWWM
jgi:hypothetical protein